MSPADQIQAATRLLKGCGLTLHLTDFIGEIPNLEREFEVTQGPTLDWQNIVRLRV